MTPTTPLMEIENPAPGQEEPGSYSRRDGLLAALGHRVRHLRTSRGLSQKALAQKAGLSPRFIAQLESGHGNISVARLAEIGRALEVPLSTLLSFQEHTRPAGDDANALRLEIGRRLDRMRTDELRRLVGYLRNGEDGQAAYQGVVSLIGLRGAGKSTIGPLLARARGWPFLELDEEIQESTGLATQEIFELHGEDYYRRSEREALLRLLELGEPVVVAVSGGAVTDPAMFRLLREETTLIWIKANPEEHMARVISQGDQRPMANRPNAMEELRRLLESRKPYYEQAHLIVETSHASPEACVGELIASMERR